MASTTLKENTQTSVSEPLFGPASIDEAFSLSVAYQKVCKNITPEIERKTDELLDK